MKAAYWIPFCHFDLGFYGSKLETLSRGNSTISSAMKIAEEDKDFRFLLESTDYVDNFVRSHPEKVEKLRRLVHAGNIELLPEWSGTFQSPMDGEVMVRNVLYAKTYLEEKFGVNPSSIQFTDIGELTPQIPQILKGLEVYHCVNSRGGPENTVVYWMEGLDGSRVLVLNQILSYAWAMMYTRFGLEVNLECLKRSRFEDDVKRLSKVCPVSLGMQYGLDGMVPTENIAELARQWNAQSEIKIIPATLTEYFEAIKSEKGAEDIPVIRGELNGVWVGGTGPSGGDPTINTLFVAEKFATIAHLLGKLENPSKEIREVWTRLLDALYHGVAPETAAYQQMARLYAENLLERALVSIAENVEVPRGEYVVPIVVFNPLSWRRDGIVSLHYSQYSKLWEQPYCNSEFVNKLLGIDLGHEPENLEITDSAGNCVACEVTDIEKSLLPNGTLTFKAENVPSIGYKTFYIRFKEKKSVVITDLQWEDDDKHLVVRNSKVGVEVDKASGAISIKDLESGKTLVDDAQPIVYELPKEASAFTFPDVDFSKPHLMKVEKVEAGKGGPVKNEMKIFGELLGAKFQLIVTLYRESEAVDITIKTDGNFEKKGFLVFDVPTTLSNPKIDYGVPYGTNNWDNYVPESKSGGETPLALWETMRNMEKFVVVFDEHHIVIIASFGKGFRKEKSGISLTLSWVDKNPKKEEVIFKHRFVLGEKEKAEKAFKVGWEFTSPLIPIGIYDTITDKSLPSEHSFCTPKSDNVVVTVIKKAEKSDDTVIRYYEAEGKKTTSEMTFMGETRKKFVNMLEHTIEKETGDSLKAFEIKTVKFQIKG